MKALAVVISQVRYLYLCIKISKLQNLGSSWRGEEVSKLNFKTGIVVRLSLEAGRTWGVMEGVATSKVLPLSDGLGIIPDPGGRGCRRSTARRMQGIEMRPLCPGPFKSWPVGLFIGVYGSPSWQLLMSFPWEIQKGNRRTWALPLVRN